MGQVCNGKVEETCRKACCGMQEHSCDSSAQHAADHNLKGLKGLKVEEKEEEIPRCPAVVANLAKSEISRPDSTLAPVVRPDSPVALVVLSSHEDIGEASLGNKAAGEDTGKAALGDRAAGVEVESLQEGLGLAKLSYWWTTSSWPAGFHNLSAVPLLAPGMSLVFGRRNAGKSLLLRSLAGHVSGYSAAFVTNGRITFDMKAVLFEDGAKSLPMLTILESLYYASLLSTASSRCGLNIWSRGGMWPTVENAPSDVLKLLKALGFQQKDYSRLLRDCSGGERRRAILGELLLSDFDILLMEDATSGLDSDSVEKIVHALRTWVKRGSRWVLVEAKTMPDNITCIFDKAMALCSGQYVHYGPLENIAVGTGDTKLEKALSFMQDLDKKDHGQGHAFSRTSVSHRRSCLAQLAGCISSCLPLPSEVLFLVQRELILRKRTVVVWMFSLSVHIFFAGLQAVFFWQLDSSQMRYRILIVYFSPLVSGLNGLAEMPIESDAGNVYHRHHSAGLYRPASLVVAQLFMSILSGAFYNLTMAFPLYLTTNFVHSRKCYAQYVCAIQFFATISSMSCRAVAAVCPPELPSVVFGTTFLLLEAMFNGLLIPATSLRHVAHWIYLVNPATWVCQIILRCEYLSGNGGNPQGQLLLRAANIQINQSSRVAFLILMSELVLVVLLNIWARCSSKIGSVSRAHLCCKAKQPQGIQLTEHSFQLGGRSEDHAVVHLCFAIDSFVVWDVVSRKHTSLLSNIRMTEAKAGELLAIMGPSGSGKSTLLGLLSGRTSTGTLEGQTWIEWQTSRIKAWPRTKAFKNSCSFVDQHIAYCPGLTVQEVVTFRSLLHGRPLHTVWNALEAMDMHQQGNVLVSALSASERKRLDIAVEFAVEPAVLLLDEPTTGLDAIDAFVVCQHLSRLAKLYRRTVVLSVHQPSEQVFRLFDQLLLLCPGGKPCYSGSAATAVQHLDISGLPGNSGDKILKYASTCTPCNQGSADSTQTFNVSADATTTPPVAHTVTLPGTAKTFRLLFARAARMQWRSTGAQLARLVAVALTASLFGFTTLGRDARTCNDVVSAASLFFFSSEFLGMVFGTFAVQFCNPIQLAMKREWRAGWYSLSIQIAAHAIVDVVCVLVAVALFLTIVVAVAGLPDGAQVLWLSMFMLTKALATLWVGELAVLICDPMLAIFVLIGFIVGQEFFSGYYISPRYIPSIEWMFWMLPSRYQVEGMVMSYYGRSKRLVVNLDGRSVTSAHCIHDFFDGSFRPDRMALLLTLPAATCMVIKILQLLVVSRLAMRQPRADKAMHPWVKRLLHCLDYFAPAYTILMLLSVLHLALCCIMFAI